jgi:MFS family permease
MGTWMEQTAMSWFIYQTTNSKFLLGAVVAVSALPMMLLSVWGGSLADRYPKRDILVGTQIAQMICAFVLAIGVWLHVATPLFIIVISACNGAAMGFDIPARQAFTVEMTSREDLLNAISLNSSIFHAARVIGPAVAGFVVASIGVALCFALNGVSFVAVIAGLLMMRVTPLPKTEMEQTSAWAHAWSGIRYAMGHQRLRTILLLFLGIGIFGWSYTVLMPAFARDVLHLGANGYGILMAASGAGALIGSLLVATFGDRFAPRALAFGGIYLFSIALFAFACLRSFWLALPPLFFAGFGLLLFFSTSNTVMQRIVPDHMRGRVMGVWSLFFSAMIPLGSMEVGAVAHWLSTPIALGFGAIACAACGVVTRIVIARRERLAAN